MAAARSVPLRDEVPYGFERRVLARLPARVAPDFGALWSRALWRACAPCAAITLLLGAWSWVEQNAPPPSDWSQDFDNTVLAAAEPEAPLDLLR